MHIDDLTNSQLILLVLLVVFVASIATSIATIALYSESETPNTPVVRTLNRIIERTIEKPVESQTNNSQLVEEDIRFIQGLVSINNSKEVVNRLRRSSVILTTINGEYLGIGFAVGEDKKKTLLPRIISQSVAHIDDIEGPLGKIKPNDEGFSLVTFEEEVNDSYLTVADPSKIDIGMAIYAYEKTRNIERLIDGVVYEVVRGRDDTIRYLLPSFFKSILNPGAIVVTEDGEFIGFVQDSSGAIGLVNEEDF